MAEHTPPQHSQSDRDVALQRFSVFGVLKRAAFQFMEDRAFILGGALAFYTSLSLGPLVMILLWVGGSADVGVQQGFVDEIRGLIGEGGGSIMEIIIANAREQPELGNVSAVISVLVLILSATAAFAHLQTTMNIVWNVRRSAGREIRGWFWKRLVSLIMIGLVGVLVLASLGVSTVIAFLASWSPEALPGARLVWAAADAVVTTSTFTLLFATVFKFLPDVEIDWRDVWVGALTTAAFLWVGKGLIGLYLGQSSVGSAYGAAGSLVIFLVWVYYCAILVFFGAEITQVWARSQGRRIRPSGKAEFVVSNGS
jgi:membrane protein